MTRRLINKWFRHVRCTLTSLLVFLMCPVAPYCWCLRVISSSFWVCPAKHKYAAIRFLYNRLNTYNLHEDEYGTEVNTIHSIIFNNAFPIHPRNPPHPSKITTPNRQTTTTTRKWARFTYVGRETTFITNLFKKTDLIIALRTNNTIQRLLMHIKQITEKADKCTQSGVYKLTCPDCNSRMWGKLEEIFCAI